MSGQAPPDVDGPEAFATHFKVSRETLEKIQTYERLLRRWQGAVNLVAPSTLDVVWKRHFADSAQLLRQLPESPTPLVDLGSGGGFPGLVLAIMLHGAGRGGLVRLVESDQRKAAFLREVARAVDISVEVLSTRIESDASVCGTGQVATVTARALAPLDRLLQLAAPFFSETTVGVFLKGRDAAREIDAARRSWRFEVETVASLTDPDGRIVIVRRLVQTGSGERP